MTSLITTDLVRLGADWGSDKHDVIRALAGVVDDAGRATSKEQLIEDAFARESTSATGLPGGIAIPHCRTAGVEVPTLAFARLDPPVDFGAKDGPADLAFLIAAPAGGDADHLTILTKLARALVKPAFTDALRSAESVEEVVDVVTHELGEPAARRRSCLRCALGSSHAGRRRDHDADAGSGRRRPGRGDCRCRDGGADRPQHQAVAGRGHRLPDRHRPHLHGRRGARGCRRARRGRPRGRDPGLGGRHAAAARHDLPRRRGDLRRRRRRA